MQIVKKLAIFCGCAYSALALSACYFAPGMYLGETSNEDGTVDTLATFHGAEVHLQSITPAAMAGAVEEAAKKTAIPQELLDYKPEAYKLGKFDVVQVTVWEHQELSLPLGPYRNDKSVGQLIDENGEMFYPYAGQIKAEGLTITELRDKIEQGLSAVLNKPQLEVRLLESQSKKAYVQGGVVRAGVIPLSNIPTTLLQAINGCGGVSPANGDPTQVELIRDGKTFDIDLMAAYPTAQGPGDILLKDGDVIRVAESSESKVFVLGELNRQMALPILNGSLTLSQALAEVGGMQTMSAKSQGIYVIRGDLNKINVYHLNARNPMALVFGDQFKLQPHDIVYVDATGLARWNRVISQILPTAQTFYYGMQTIHQAKIVKGDLENW